MIDSMSTVLISAVLAQASSWPVGSEREVDEGYYMQVFAAQDGWRIWRTDTANGVGCKAVKSAVGQPHPIPVGVANYMTRGTPFLEINTRVLSRAYSYRWVTTHYGDVRVKYRPVGGRFYIEKKNDEFSAEGFPDQRYEVVLSSWEYPAVRLGFTEEHATFDFAGREWAETQVRACEAAE